MLLVNLLRRWRTGVFAVGLCTETREIDAFAIMGGSYQLMIEPPSSEFGSGTTGLFCRIIKPAKSLLFSTLPLYEAANGFSPIDSQAGILAAI
jgi:hypothetical protein